MGSKPQNQRVLVFIISTPTPIFLNFYMPKKTGRWFKSLTTQLRQKQFWVRGTSRRLLEDLAKACWRLRLWIFAASIFWAFRQKHPATHQGNCQGKKAGKRGEGGREIQRNC